jgi:hypothetical protein
MKIIVIFSAEHSYHKSIDTIILVEKNLLNNAPSRDASEWVKKTDIYIMYLKMECEKKFILIFPDTEQFVQKINHNSIVILKNGFRVCHVCGLQSQFPLTIGQRSDSKTLVT